MVKKTLPNLNYSTARNPTLPPLPPNERVQLHPLSKKNPASSGVVSENTREYLNTMNNESADARSSSSTPGYMNDAAGKKKKEDDIRNESNAMDDKIEKEEVITDTNDEKEDKTKKVDDKKLKLTVKVNKTTSTINKMKNETPRSRLKSIDKSDKKNKKHAKQLGVNVRKISEFLLLNKGREDFEKLENPAIKPAKQDNKEKL